MNPITPETGGSQGWLAFLIIMVLYGLSFWMATRLGKNIFTKILWTVINAGWIWMCLLLVVFMVNMGHRYDIIAKLGIAYALSHIHVWPMFGGFIALCTLLVYWLVLGVIKLIDKKKK